MDVLPLSSCVLNVAATQFVDGLDVPDIQLFQASDGAAHTDGLFRHQGEIPGKDVQLLHSRRKP